MIIFTENSAIWNRVLTRDLSVDEWGFLNVRVHKINLENFLIALGRVPLTDTSSKNCQLRKEAEL